MLADEGLPEKAVSVHPPESTSKPQVLLAPETLAWQVLVAAGVPLRLPQSAEPPQFVDGSVRAALALVVDSGLTDNGRERDALVAWLGALRDHFPSRFALVAALPSSRLEELRSGVDRGRYIKLRRIALAHLAVLV